MVLPVTAVNVSDAYASLRNSGANVMSYLKQVQTQITTNAVSATFFMTAMQACVQLMALAQNTQANTVLTSALDAYVQQQVGNPTLDVHGSMASAMTALGSLISAMVSDYPKDANGYLADRTFAVDGSLAWRVIPATQFQQTPAAISAYLATVS